MKSLILFVAILLCMINFTGNMLGAPADPVKAKYLFQWNGLFDVMIAAYFVLLMEKKS